MIIKWLTGLIKGKKRKERAKVEIEELKKAILEDPKFRDEVLRELEYRTGRRDLLKAGVLGLLGFTVGSIASSAQPTPAPPNTSIVRDTVSDYAGVKIPKPCTCIVAQDGTGDYNILSNEDASEVIQKAIDVAHKKGGGEVRIREGKYLVEKTIHIGPNICVHGIGQGVKIKGNVDTIIEVRTKYNLTTNFSNLSDMYIEGNYNNIGIKIKDSYGTIVERVIFNKVNTAIFITSEQGWCEGTRIRDVSIRDPFKYGILIKKIGGTGGFQGTLFCNIAINLRQDYSKGIAIYNHGGNATFIDTQIWIKAKHAVGLYINGGCSNMYGNLRIENFKLPAIEVYAIYIDKNANIKGSFINLNAVGGKQAFTEIVKDVSNNSGRYTIITGDVWYTNSKYHQIELYATKAKKAIRIGWYERNNEFELVTYDSMSKVWNPEDCPITFKCPTKFEKRLQIPIHPPEKPVKGAIYYDVKSKRLYIYNGKKWNFIMFSE